MSAEDGYIGVDGKAEAGAEHVVGEIEGEFVGEVGAVGDEGVELFFGEADGLSAGWFLVALWFEWEGSDVVGGCALGALYVFDFLVEFLLFVGGEGDGFKGGHAQAYAEVCGEKNGDEEEENEAGFPEFLFGSGGVGGGGHGFVLVGLEVWGVAPLIGGGARGVELILMGCLFILFSVF